MLANQSERLALVVCGLILARVTSEPFVQVIGPLAIYPANVGIIALAIAFPLRHTSPGLRRLWYIMLGISLDGLVFLAIKSRYTYYSPQAIIGALILLALYSVGLALRTGTGASLSNDTSRVAPSVPWLIPLAAAMTILTFRLTYLATASVPNEARSICIVGFEAHHINFGVLGFVLLDLMKPPKTRAAQVIYNLGAGSAMGLVLDQGLYYALSQVRDAAYPDPLSLVGALAGLFAATVTSVVARRRCRKWGRSDFSSG